MTIRDPMMLALACLAGSAHTAPPKMTMPRGRYNDSSGRCHGWCDKPKADAGERAAKKKRATKQARKNNRRKK